MSFCRDKGFVSFLPCVFPVQPFRKFGATAAGAVLALALTGCHKDTATDELSTPPVQLSALNKSFHQPTIVKDNAPTGKTVPAADAVPATVSAQRDGEENVSPSASSPGKSEQSAGNMGKPVSAVKAVATPVDLKSLPLPNINPKAAVTVGPGITIGEPQPDHNDAQLAAFGAGCAKWLNYAVGGLPQMGCTPVWESTTRFEARTKRPNYQLTKQDAPVLYSMLGVTHAVLGQISGDAAHCSLTYQIISVPDGKAVGNPLTLTGTQEQIVTGLPKLGADIAGAVGIRSITGLPSVGATGSDLVMLGGLPWTAEAHLTPQQMQAARELAPRLAPAGMLLTSSRLMDDAEAQSQTVQTLLRQGKENGHALAEVAVEARGAPREVADAITRAVAKNPNNYLYIAAGTRLMRVVGNLQGEQKAISRGVRVAPHNVNTWLRLATTWGDIGSSLRQGRTVNMISRSEWRILNDVYAKQLAAAQKAAEIDPQNGSAWLAVAQAGTFAGEQQQAAAAYWKAVELDRSNVEVHAWGLQMFQEKWGGSPTDLQKVADIAADAPLKTMAERRRIAIDLKEAGCEAQATGLYTRMEGEAEATVAQNPNDAQAHYDLAVCYDAIKMEARATREYKTVVALHPNDPRALFDLGEHYMRRGRYKDAARELQETLRLTPGWGHARLQLGLALKDDGQRVEAEKELRQALTLPLSTLDVANVHFFLAKIRMMDNQWPQAVKELETSIKASPYYPESYELLCGAYAETKQYQQAIEIGRKGLQLNPFSIRIYDELGYIYAMTKQPELSIAQCRKALRLNPDDVIAHGNMGDELYKLGHKEEARSEWQTVLRLAPDSNSGKDAQKSLAEKK